MFLCKLQNLNLLRAIYRIPCARNISVFEVQFQRNISNCVTFTMMTALNLFKIMPWRSLNIFPKAYHTLHTENRILMVINVMLLFNIQQYVY